MLHEQEDEKEILEDSVEILCLSFIFLFKFISCNHKSYCMLAQQTIAPCRTDEC